MSESLGLPCNGWGPSAFAAIWLILGSEYGTWLRPKAARPVAFSLLNRIPRFERYRFRIRAWRWSGAHLYVLSEVRPLDRRALQAIGAVARRQRVRLSSEVAADYCRRL